ncbi:hypothetical protein [Flavobacterium sp. H122]|uniref:hypothetical protein n=1 Tax=Flavobacterium sp. H122 TaxID=2529860 RepID=UPI0010AAE7DC|nr:hypothetical protein [Flavobacterium sp. H122]
MKNRIKFFLILIVAFVASCTVKKSNDKDFEDKLLDMIIASSEGKEIEFQSLYNLPVTEIASDNEEKLLLAEKLKAKGFEVTDWGRGNYDPLGPRIVSLNLKKGDCECEVSKIYYSTISASKYKMTEKINCKTITK